MDITISQLILLCTIFVIIGAVLLALLQCYLLVYFGNLPVESDEQKDINAKYSLPLAIQQKARTLIASSKSPTSSNATIAAGATAAVDTAPLISINFVMQFLFHELKNSNRVRKWFYRKLSLELDELLAKTTTGKLFDKLTIKELELGEQFPEIRALNIHSVELDDAEGRIENLDLILQLHYAGNFRTTIDADMVLGKKGSLMLKVKQLSGLARLQFTRKPYTHWSLSFLGDPEIDLAIESKYQGRQMQSNIASLISNQIRKAVRRKHTLPNYKLRYKPFFHKTPEEEAGDCDLQPNGLLEVKVSEISRLTCPEHMTDIYCTLTLASLAFVEARQKDHRNVLVSLDVQIHKAKNQQIGILFKQTTEQMVEIEAVLPNTPACKSNLKAGDVLVAIEGKRIASIQQVAKVVKGLHSSNFSLRIERVIPGIIRNDAILEDLELYEDLGDIRTGYGVIGAAVGSVAAAKANEFELTPKQLVLRHSSLEKTGGANSSESSMSSTPTNSPKKSKFIAKALKKTISRENSEHGRDEDAKLKLKLATKIEEKSKTPLRCPIGEGVNDVEHYYQHSTVDCKLSRLVCMEDLSQFKLDARSKFFNVCVYGKCPGESVLLGFVNIPINHLLAECCETSLSQCWKRFELNPPIPQDLKSHKLFNQSGFNANLCFGDILFAFSWDGNPNMQVAETLSKPTGKSKAKTNSQADKKDDDSGVFDNTSIKSFSTSDTTITTATSSTSINSNQTRAHTFIRTHFQRATQCDFCGKKIWLKDAVQCRECAMCCHKKCITKCQNSTVCGPVDCSGATAATATPEFMVTEADTLDASEGEEAMPCSNDEESSSSTPAKTAPPTAGLEVHRSSLTGLLAQGIKRVNSANNLAIPGIVSSLAGGGGGSGGNTSGGNTSAKSLPPSPQHSPSRKSSLVMNASNSFEIVTHRLENISSEVTALSAEQISSITEPIINISKEEDVMTLAKTASRNLYADVARNYRVEKINLLLTKLRLALDSETAMHSVLTAATTTKANDHNTNNDISSTTPGNPSPTKVTTIGKSEERVQALSVIMLYLCTGLQHAQGVAFQ